jgi:hypothetical protein
MSCSTCRARGQSTTRRRRSAPSGTCRWRC